MSQESIKIEKIIRSDIAREFTFFQLKKETQQEILQKIEKIDNNRGNTALTGAILEEIVTSIFVESDLFKVNKGVRSTTNEMDVLVSLSHIGLSLRCRQLIPSWIPDRFIIECKNYSTTVGVTYVGKFYSLLQVSNLRLGLFISNLPISGYNQAGKMTWNASCGFIKKVHLKHMGTDNEVMIVPISISELKENLENENGNIIELIKVIKDAIELDINSEILKERKHPNEEKFKD